MAPKAAKKTTKKATTTKKVVKKAAKKVVKKAVKATKKATKKTTTKKVVKKPAKKVVKKAAKASPKKKAAKASPKKKAAKASSPKKKKAAAVEEVKAAEEAAPETKADFYTAKNDGAVDIGDSYLGTGSGENTTLTADMFHQHGDIQVMQSWETPFMHALADALVAHLNANKVALMAHGKISVLEIGFGLGLSATKLQEGMQDLVAEYGSNLIEHHIIELNDAVYANLEKFAADEAAKGRAKVVPHKGNWKDVVQDLIGKELFSGLLYDPFPTCKEEQHYHQLMFISDQHAGPLLHKGGALVYCNLTSLGVLCADRAGDWSKVWTETQKPYLLGQSFEILRTEYKCTGFTDDSVSYSLFKITDDMKVKRKEQKCNYYGGDDHNFALVPVCVKQ